MLEVNKVYFEHIRVIGPEGEYEACGGHTVAWEIEGDTMSLDKPVFRMGIALCCPKDNYNKKEGRRLAEERVKLMDGPIEGQSKWSARFTMIPGLEKLDKPKEFGNMVRASALKHIYATKGEKEPIPNKWESDDVKHERLFKHLSKKGRKITKSKTEVK